MARLYEDTAKELLARAGLPVPRGQVAGSPAEAAAIAASLGGRVAVKALVPIGGRGLAGAVRAVDAPAAAAAAADLLGTTVRGFPVARVLVEEWVTLTRELYAAVTFDDRGPVALVGLGGGVEVERLQSVGQQVARGRFDPWRGLAAYQARELWRQAGLQGEAVRGAAEALVRLAALFVSVDATLVEVNPLGQTADGRFVAVGAMVAVDDDALARQPGLAPLVEPGNERAWRPLTELERLAAESDAAEPYRGTARYTEFDGGDLACLCGGGGASLLLQDALRRCGLRPANYSEFGGNPSVTKVAGLARAALAKPGVRGLFVCQNITSNTQVDLSAEGVLLALGERNLTPPSFPVLMRLAGVGEDRARELCQAAGVAYYADDVTLEEAAARMATLLAAPPVEP